MQNKLLKSIENKYVTTPSGQKVYNVTEEELQKIISKTAEVVIDRFKQKIDTASDEWDTVYSLEKEIIELKTEFGVPIKSKKIKP